MDAVAIHRAPVKRRQRHGRFDIAGRDVADASARLNCFRP
jgi:hypothetical protein